MRPLYLMVAVLIVAITAVCTAARYQKADISRGSYIVNRVAMCTDCHTPMTRNGRPDAARQLAGARITFRPTVAVPEWEDMAPNLTPAGFLRNWKDTDIVRFLMTGRDPRGNTADPPMPQYRLSRQDALGVTAYLRTIKAVKTATQPARQENEREEDR